MLDRPWKMRWLAVTLFALLGLAIAQYDTNDKIPDKAPQDELFRFVTRPDIRAPRYNVTFYNRAAVSHGYWFISPYEQVGLDPPTNPLWVGPHIYDNNGELVWSSSNRFRNANSFDFKRSYINGEYMLSVTIPFEESAILMDEHYEVKRKLYLGQRAQIDPHDFNVVANGTIVLLTRSNTTKASKEVSQAAGFDGRCKVLSHGWQSRNATTENWDPITTWHALEHIGLEESTMGNRGINERCEHWWDFIHTNSVDMCPDGNILLSARHTDTIYMISKVDGSIIWRLGGRYSNFKGDFEFSRQHHIRCHGQNQTHTNVSFLDNARGQDAQRPTHPFSRGLIVSLETPKNWTGASNTKMNMKIMSQFNHPYKKYNRGRGDCEMMENGNIFMGWSDQGLHSEHTPDGKMIMKAELTTDWLRTYRTFKFPLVGRPKEKPAVVAIASNAPNASMTTRIYVSWNGATDVSHWNLYKTNENAKHTLLVVSAPRLGFETEMVYDGFASYIMVEAVDAQGVQIENGKSSVIKTIPAANMNTTAVTQESKWLEEEAFDDKHPWISKVKASGESPTVMFFAGLFVSVGAIFGIWMARKLITRKTFWWRESASYEPIVDEEREVEGKEDFEMDHDRHVTDSKNALDTHDSVESLMSSDRD